MKCFRNHSKKFCIFALLLLSVPGFADWKGDPDTSTATAGASLGFGIVDYTLGFTLLGTASKKLIQKGFVPDINNSVSIELLAGPVFLPRSNALLYSTHFRWDFVKDSEWTFFAVGGVGGNVLFSTSRFVLLPRFGVGAFWTVKEYIKIRADLSSDVFVAGVNFLF